MEWEEQGLRMSLVLDSASVLMLTASALTATVLSSILELLSQASLSLCLYRTFLHFCYLLTKFFIVCFFVTGFFIVL